MPVYMVERVLPGTTIDAIEAMRRSADAACHELSAKGKPVRYLRSIFTPGESRCRCLFDAPSADLVQELNDAAQLPYNRIIIALDIPGETANGDSRSGNPDSHH